MKKTVWLILSTLLVTSALAQPTTNPPPAAASTPAATSAVTAPSVAKSGKKARISKKAAQATSTPVLAEKPVSLSPGPATVTGDRVSVRGQPTIFSEIIKRLNTGDPVTVIEQVVRERTKPGDPAQWAKIAIPAGVHVWVYSAYIDPTNKVVLPNKLNVRTGPGENYSIVGLLERGAMVKEVSMKGHWLEIEPPADAYGFIAAMYLKQEGKPAAVPPVVSIAPPETEPAPTPTVVPEATSVASTTTEVPTPVTTPESSTNTATPAVTPATNEQASASIASTAASESEPIPPAYEELPPKRIVQHEGVVKSTWSIQAPTKFELVDPVSGRTVNYLYTSSTNLDLRRYKGLHIIVTGEEGLDERWKNTPVITIQRIQVIE